MVDSTVKCYRNSKRGVFAFDVAPEFGEFGHWVARGWGPVSCGVSWQAGKGGEGPFPLTKDGRAFFVETR